MTQKIDTLGSARRFGARYGRTVKHKFAAVEKLSRAYWKCPYCHKVAAKKKAMGIWQCQKCNAKFTSRAFTITKEVAPLVPIKKQEVREEEVQTVEAE